MPPQQQHKERAEKELSGGTWFVLFMTAAFFDVLKFILQFIPVLGQLLAIAVGWVAFATFWLVLKIHGVKYSKGGMVAGFLSDFIPVLDVGSELGTIGFLYYKSKSKKVLTAVPGGAAISQTLDKVA